MSTLNVEEINVGYDGMQVIWDVSLEVEGGEIVALVGPNGAGKTTTLKAINGVLPLMSGKIEFKDQRIDNLPPHDVVSTGLAMVPEGREVFPFMSAHDNLDMGAYSIQDRGEVREHFETVYNLFPRLKERRNQQAKNLSGGEQQMLVMGRALMSNPEFLMLDEPSLGLQPGIVATVFENINELNQEQGTTILLVEQNVRRSLETASRGYVLEDGRINTSGASKELLESERVQEAYLGIEG